ncbi:MULTISPECIES: molybdenum cofactor guanylyltransferase [unclassified Pseudofrankia]|uniref:molybdenum cofactor guanylyltransferase n=1 Tax=unclassified Pseudofrankia TaxID=2994372 RepID=UPI0008D9386F|nr:MULTISPECIES: molybdenum cofactor guanylyltransferase [unclassified Pseudofrankia]MDT3443054.1 molybdenum cofactor guanylyltransferase [Pseudofrankia sp. BMG5.37]OHV62226.1 hypothetical protein BCD48_39555 [Pseudofrankia sp. BMG5.36]
MTSWDAVVLAGGRGSRLGGADKAAVTIGGRSLLDRVLSVLATVEPAVGRVVVVGPDRPGLARAGVVLAREDPPGGGPVAGIAAGLVHVRAPLVAVLAVDMPFLGTASLAELRAAVTAPPRAGASGPGAPGAVDVALLVDPTGRDQTLASVWRSAALRSAVPPRPTGAAVRALLTGRTVARVPADALSCLDCDAEPDVLAARAAADRMGL